MTVGSLIALAQQWRERSGKACRRFNPESPGGSRSIWEVPCYTCGEKGAAHIWAECADELDALRGSLEAELQQIENALREVIRDGDGDGNIAKETAAKWADQLADLRTRLRAEAPGG